jgi:hypothetical protein
VPGLLAHARATNDFQLTWPAWARNYLLETAPVLGTPTTWTPVTNAPASYATQLSVIVPGAGEGYFRLRLTNGP